MRLVSVTMTGNSEATIGDAIASVAPWVDAVIVADTGVTDRSIDIAREVAGEKLIVRKFKWINDYSAGRNFLLQAGAEEGGHWAVMVDADERIDLRGEDIHGELERATTGHFMIAHESGDYVQPRFFKLPAPGKFSGPTHEAYPADAFGAGKLEKCVFRDRPKTPEQLRAKNRRDISILRPYIRKHPKEGRWHYYLGDALANLGQHQEAIDAFQACANMRTWDEEAAWACYRMAICRCALKQWQFAVDACAKGLARHSGIAELAWYAGWASLQGGNPRQAIWWARIAISLGHFRGCGRDIRRVGFTNPFGLWEGPYDVLRHAFIMLGDRTSAAQANMLRLEAIHARARMISKAPLPAGIDGRWDGFFRDADRSNPQPYGSDETYKKGADYLDGLRVEDWGCGLGWMRRFVPAERYAGIDGSQTPFADKIVDLRTYRSESEAVFLRHVLEHNDQWRDILRNAVASFRRRMVLVVHTPLQPETRRLSTTSLSMNVTVPDYGFAREDIAAELGSCLKSDEEVNGEHVFYCEKPEALELRHEDPPREARAPADG